MKINVSIIAINFFIIAIILFGSNYLLLLEEMAAAARSMRADARLSPSRTGTRLSSVRPDKLCSQSYLNAQIQL